MNEPINIIIAIVLVLSPASAALFVAGIYVDREYITYSVVGFVFTLLVAFAPLVLFSVMEISELWIKGREKKDGGE